MVDNPPIDISEPRATFSASAFSHPPSYQRTESGSGHTLDVENTMTTNPRKQEDDIPPDGGYGWVCVMCAFFINGHTWGVNSSYGVFLSYYLTHDYFPNTSALVYAFIGGLSISQALLIAPLATRVVRSFGTHVCLYLGVFFQTMSLIGASFAHQKYQIILAQGICFGWGMGFLFVGSVGVPSQWFTKKRSIANAISAAGSGLGGLIYSLATQRIIETIGLPWAFRVLGIVSCAVNLTASTLLRDRNTQVGSRHKSFDISLLKRPEFVLLQGWSFFSMLGYATLLFSLPSFAKAIDLSSQQGALVGALLNLGQMLGRPCIGLASDRYGRLNLAAFCSALCGVFCLAFWIPSSVASSKMGLLTFFAIPGGALAGTFWCTIAPVSAEVVGIQDLPAGLSLTWVLIAFPTTFAEVIALELRQQEWDPKWTYLPVQIFTTAAYIAGAACLWIVRGWKVGEMEEVEKRLSRTSTKESSGVIEKSENTDKEGAVLEPDQLDRTRPQSILKAGWGGRDLFRRMVAWKIV